jgi:hypothetical protein
MANQVMIVKCSDASKWYNDCIGEVFTVISEEQNEYKVRQPPSAEYNGYQFLNFISKEDAHYLG